MATDAAGPWADQLRAQYRTDANLAARQSLYAFQRPRLDLPRLVIARVGPDGGETVADVGCGNGAYLAELRRRGHAGGLLGVDLSPGMLRVTRDRVPGARVVAGDAAALPLRDGGMDLTLAMHMLYHVPGPRAAVTELRRITRPGGRVVVVLNGAGHLAELRELVASALPGAPDRESLRPRERIDLDAGHALLAEVFPSVARHDFPGELLIPGPEPVARYVRSMMVTATMADPDEFVAAVASRIPAGRDGMFRVRTHAGCLVCS